MAKHTFTTTLIQAEGKNATGIEVPPEIVTALNKGKRPPVIVHIGDYSYRNTIASMSGVFMVGVSAEHREGAGVQGGDEIEVTIELDTEPRTVDIPDDLASELAENDLSDAFDNLAPSRQKEFVRQVTSAKAEETRIRRIDKIISQLRES